MDFESIFKYIHVSLRMVGNVVENGRKGSGVNDHRTLKRVVNRIFHNFQIGSISTHMRMEWIFSNGCVRPHIGKFDPTNHSIGCMRDNKMRANGLIRHSLSPPYKPPLSTLLRSMNFYISRKNPDFCAGRRDTRMGVEKGRREGDGLGRGDGSNRDFLSLFGVIIGGSNNELVSFFEKRNVFVDGNG